MTPAGKEPATRLFVACDLPPDVLAAIAAWQQASLVPRAELRVAHALHLTLCFLGETPDDRIPAIRAALAGLRLQAVTVTVAAALFLPERGRKRVVALRLDDPSGALATVQHDVSDALVSLQVYRPEQRAFLPHVTVARFRRPGAAFPLQNVNVAAFGLPEVILYASLLQKGGAVHTPLATYPTC